MARVVITEDGTHPDWPTDTGGLITTILDLDALVAATYVAPSGYTAHLTITVGNPGDIVNDDDTVHTPAASQTYLSWWQLVERLETVVGAATIIAVYTESTTNAAVLTLLEVLEYNPTIHLEGALLRAFLDELITATIMTTGDFETITGVDY